MVVTSLAATGSHGVLALYTAPSLGAVGAATMVGAYAAEVVSGRCTDLRPYARFPVGLPSTLHVGWLAPRSGPAPRPVVAPSPPPPQPPAPPLPIVPPAPPPAPPAPTADAADAGATNPADAGAAPAADAPDAAAPSP